MLLSLNINTVLLALYLSFEAFLCGRHFRGFLAFSDEVNFSNIILTKAELTQANYVFLFSSQLFGTRLLLQSEHDFYLNIRSPL